jgi:serine protease
VANEENKSFEQKGPSPLRIALKLSNPAPRNLKELRVPEKLLAEELGRPIGTLPLLPLVESVKPERLAEMVERARRADPRVEFDPPDFSRWHQVECPADVDPDELAKALRQLEVVEATYVMRPAPLPVMPNDDPRFPNEGYLGAAPNGIDAKYAWGFAGGDGTGIAFVDLETAWNLNHEDLQAAGITLISGVSQLTFDHGTSVLGILRMVDNGVGGVGIAPESSGRVVSQYRTAGFTNYNTVDAMLDAVSGMSFGDVLLLEAQDYDPISGMGFWPVEIALPVFDAISLATALGIVVVEAAGNRSPSSGVNVGNDLDAYIGVTGDHFFDRNIRDSGAIIVGAGSSASPHTRLSVSNFGTRVDCYGWGQNVDTTTTDAAGTNNTLYTNSFSGTSSASAIVAGAAIVVQALAQATLGYRFSPRELRGILTTNGTPSNDPTNDKIGVLPNLKAIIGGSQLNLAPDLYMRDYVGDVGNPTAGVVSQSPDIIVKQARVTNPQATYGAGSGTENDPALSDDVETGQDNFVYVRLLDRGGSDATNVSVDVYWSPPATLVSPVLWNFIGSVAVGSVPTGNILTVSDAITWPSASIPTQGHYCFVAIAGNAQDPQPVSMRNSKPDIAFNSFDEYVEFIENNNNVAWRNFNVVTAPPPPPPGFYRLPFFISGAFDTGHVFDLETIAQLPEGSRAFVEVPDWLAEAWRPHVNNISEVEKTRTVRISLRTAGSHKLGSGILHTNSLAKCKLLVQIPEAARSRHAYEIAVRQIYKKTEVGRVTWRLGGPKKR